MTRTLFFGAALLLGLAAAPAARAQSVELTMDIFTSSVLSQTTTLLNQNALEASYRNSGRTAGASGRSSTRAARPAASTAFTPTPAARQQALAQQNAGKPAATAQQFTAAFGPGGSTDYTVLYRKLLAGSGLRENDVADAFAAYLVATYRVAHGEAPAGALLPASGSAGVRRQFAPAVANVLSGKSATAAAALGEYLKLQTALLAVGAQGSPASLVAFRRNVASTLKQRFQLDVMQLTLTSQGLVKQ
ncbi:hypothetical protein Q5H93_17315 [Hymenobacter sp. ASUV-10]|uniref:DUF4142 domain-containing protein n=1 Tax=Hymenobacter aranciens TaxID=3063996 RepID=A0ABT9BHM1_9BACT|nr:DUF6683 family protein [Hymenobacter sp. ASUV-10]MDO7876507.1 hypothetical protein [Hymenobacter sp. ASUV-10]